MCDKGLIWNSSNCECECDKSCNVGEYLDFENCKCRKKLIDKLVEKQTENINEEKLAKIALAKHENMCKLWDEFKYLIKTINGGKSGEYGKDLMKIKFNSEV